MDEMVIAAMRKWPNVPDCTGWLGLDERGDWYMRDDATQRAGTFPQVKGSRIEHEALKAFIHRNWARTETGAWFFQNGPQRVFVELANTPWIWRVMAHGSVVSTTGQPAEVAQTWLDETGRLYAQTTLGLGLVHSQDIYLASECLEQGAWPEPGELEWAEAPRLHGFIRSPQSKTADR